MTIRRQHVSSVLGLVLGAIGCVGCLAGIVGVWGPHARLCPMTDDVFERLDSILNVVRDGVRHTQARVEASKVTAQGIENTLKTWAKRETSERLTSRLNLEQPVERLALTLAEADHWLEIASSSVDILQKALSLGSACGVPLDSETVDALPQELAALRRRLSEATEFVAGIKQRTTEPHAAESLQEPIQKALELSLRVAATLGSVDARLQEFEQELAATRTTLRDARTRTLGWILVATTGITLLSLWMAAGQAALFCVAQRRVRRTPDDSQ